MKTIIIFASILLSGCATTIYGGVGYDFGGSELKGVLETDTDSIVFRQDAWENPIGILGVRYPLGESFELDYRHISSFGGDDLINSDSVSLIMKIGGSRRGWGLDHMDRLARP